MTFEYTWWTQSPISINQGQLVFRTRATSHTEALKNYAAATSKTEDGAQLVLVQHRLCIVGPLTFDLKKKKPDVPA